MTILDSISAPLVVGDHFDVERTILSVPNADPIVEAWLTIKTDVYQADIDAAIQKAITTSLVNGTGQIEDDGDNSSAQGRIVFQLTAADTASLSANVLYVYDIQLKTAAGMIVTVETGNVIPKAQVTRTS